MPWLSRPPGLPRRSRISDFIPFLVNESIAVVSSAADDWLTVVRAM